MFIIYNNNNDGERILSAKRCKFREGSAPGCCPAGGRFTVNTCSIFNPIVYSLHKYQAASCSRSKKFLLFAPFPCLTPGVLSPCPPFPPTKSPWGWEGSRGESDTPTLVFWPRLCSLSR